MTITALKKTFSSNLNPRLKPSTWVRFWDLCVGVGVVFPFLTGGVWFTLGHLKLELAELALPVLLVSAFGGVLAWGLKIDLSSSFFFQKGKRLWVFWESCLNRSPRWALSVGTVGVGALLSWVSLQRHWAYGSGAYDLGIFTNALWNLTFQGSYVSSLKGGVNLFTDHQSPLFWLFVPFFRLYPHPELLLVIQAFGLAMGGAALFWIGKGYGTLSERMLACLPLLYWAYLPMRAANAFDFHPEVLLLPLFLGAIACLQATGAPASLLKKRVLGCVGCLLLVLAIGAKESAACVAVGVGMVWALGAAPAASLALTKRLGVILIGVGFGIFYLDTQWVPRYLGGVYSYQNTYSEFGEGLKDLFFAPWIHPLLFLKHLLGLARLKFLFWTLAPLAFLPLLNLKTAIAAVPGYLILFLTAGDHRLKPIFHYAAEPAVGLFWALPLGLVRFGGIAGRVSVPGFFGLWILFWALAGFGRSELYRVRHFLPNAHHTWLSRDLVPSVHPLVSLAAPGALVAHLATRPWVLDLPNLQLGRERQKVACVITDSAVNLWPLSTPEYQAFVESLPRNGYQPIYHCGSVSVYQAHDSLSLPCLVRQPGCPAAVKGF